nr:MAG TPA_asm: hypothetical protein [Caudoviricetes sp.]
MVVLLIIKEYRTKLNLCHIIIEGHFCRAI